MSEELIPKKEVLRLTGISYGQLYRWKRMGLIPEAWFIRRSTFTGQETFFPKEKILRRIEEILRLKEEKPLEELVKLLAPEAIPTEIAYPDPLQLSPIGPLGRELLWKSEEYTFPELVALASGVQALRQGAQPAEAKLLVDLLRTQTEALRQPTGLTLVLAEKAVDREAWAIRIAMGILAHEPVALDRDTRVKVRVDLERVLEEVKKALGGGVSA